MKRLYNKMRTLLLIPLVVALTAVLGVGLCMAIGWDPHYREMLPAAGAILIAGMGGLVPLLLVRGASQLAVSQAALVGTMVHLFIGVGLAAIPILGHFGLDASFIYWLLAFYWMTLIVLVAACVQAVKSAPAASNQAVAAQSIRAQSISGQSTLTQSTLVPTKP